MLITIFFIILTIILIILVATMTLFYKDSKYIPVVAASTTNSSSKEISLEECTIGELSERIGSEELSEKELLKVVDLVAKKHHFPKKDKGKAPKGIEDYLKFVYEFCMNKAANAKIIVKMSNTLKAINEDYRREIDDIEKSAIRDLDSKVA